MSQPTVKGFLCQPLAELARQLLYSPAQRRHDVARRAERLHDQVEPEAVYPQDFVVYRITGMQAEESGDTLLVGEAVLADLRRLVDALTRSVDIPAAEEPCLSVRELAAELDVSTKTVQRWRGLGLRWRWVRRPGAKRREVRITRMAVEAFRQRFAPRIERAARFTQIGPAARRQLVEDARALAQEPGATLHGVATRLAAGAGRAVETVRLVLQQHEREHPDDLLFEDRAVPLDAAQRRSIAEARAGGIDVAALAGQFRKTRSTIHRAVNEVRARLLRERLILVAPAPQLTDASADDILRQEPEPPAMGDAAVTHRRPLPVDDLPASLHPFLSGPPAEGDTLRRILMRMHALRHKAAALRDSLDLHAPRVGDLDRIEGWLRHSDEARAAAVAGGLPAVLLVVRRHLSGAGDPGRGMGPLLHLLELGAHVLVETVDSQSPWDKQGLDRVLNWNLMKAFASDKGAAGEFRHRNPGIEERRFGERPADHAKAQRREPAEVVARRIAEFLAAQGVRPA